MKNVHKLEADFPEHIETGEAVVCKDVLAKFQAYSNRESALKLRGVEGISEHTKCVMENLRSQHWTDYLMLDSVYEHSETLSEEVKKVKIEEFETVGEHLFKTAMVGCVFEKMMGDFFDKVIKSDFRATDENLLEENYCTRNYAVKQNLIDPKVYNVELNPENAPAVSCEKILTKFITFVEKEIEFSSTDNDESSKVSNDNTAVESKNVGKNDNEVNIVDVKCTMKKNGPVVVVEKALLVDVLRQLNLTEEQIQSERKLFIESMKNISSSFSKCH